VNFTKRELDILDLLGDGIGPREIAKQLGLAENYVKQRLSVLYIKTGLYDCSRQRHVLLAIWANCELFRLGLAA
jgi:DNA-binding NarL/FixJ family response regulator